MFKIEPIAGLAVTMPQSSYQVTGSDGEVEPKVDRQMPVLVGLVMGIDARIGDERFAVVPSLKVRVTSGNPDEFDPKGYPRWTVTPGVAARVGLDRARGNQRGSAQPTYVIGGMGLSVHPAWVGVNGARI